jgi:hypothetical protein
MKARVLLVLGLLAPAIVRADGGAVRLRGGSDQWMLTVFTAPEPLRVGVADVSVLAQRRDSGEALLDAEVTLTFSPPEGEPFTLPATRARATNKLLHSARVDLPVAGVWALSVTVRRGGDVASVAGELPVAPAASRLAALAPGLALPPIAVILFACHQMLKDRRRSRLRPSHEVTP